MLKNVKDGQYAKTNDVAARDSNTKDGVGDSKKYYRFKQLKLSELVDEVGGLEALKRKAGNAEKAYSLLLNAQDRLANKFLREYDYDEVGEVINDHIGDYCDNIRFKDSMASELLDDILDFAGLSTDDAKPESEERLVSLRQQLAAAKRNGDSEEAKEIQDEIDKMTSDSKTGDGPKYDKVPWFKGQQVVFTGGGWLKGRKGVLKGPSAVSGMLLVDVEGTHETLAVEEDIVEPRFGSRDSKTGDSATCDAKPGNITFGGSGYRCVKCGVTADAAHLIKHKTGDASNWSSELGRISQDLFKNSNRLGSIASNSDASSEIKRACREAEKLLDEARHILFAVRDTKTKDAGYSVKSCEVGRCGI